MVTDNLNSSVYFTYVFHGNYAQLEAYEQHFKDHVNPLYKVNLR